MKQSKSCTSPQSERFPSHENDYVNAYRATNKDTINAQARERYKNMSPEAKAKRSARVRANRLKTRYGITQAEYDGMLLAQDGKCAICGADEPKGTSDRFHVDHCHDTGAVRGLLCMPCNSGIGHLQDDKAIVLKAFEYLNRNTKVHDG